MFQFLNEPPSSLLAALCWTEKLHGFLLGQYKYSRCPFTCFDLTTFVHMIRFLLQRSCGTTTNTAVCCQSRGSSSLAVSTVCLLALCPRLRLSRFTPCILYLLKTTELLCDIQMLSRGPLASQTLSLLIPSCADTSTDTPRFSLHGGAPCRRRSC